jgi:hypothetical protein
MLFILESTVVTGWGEGSLVEAVSLCIFFRGPWRLLITFHAIIRGLQTVPIGVHRGYPRSTQYL